MKNLAKVLFVFVIINANAAFANHEIAIGLLRHDVDVFDSNHEKGKDLNLEYSYKFNQEQDGFLYNIGADISLTNSSYADVFYTGFGYRKFFTDKIYGQFDIGIAHQTNGNNGSCFADLMPREAIHLGYKINKKLSFEGYFDHISEADICNHKSLDNAGGRISFKF